MARVSLLLLSLLCHLSPGSSMVRVSLLLLSLSNHLPWLECHSGVQKVVDSIHFATAQMF